MSKKSERMENMLGLLKAGKKPGTGHNKNFEDPGHVAAQIKLLQLKQQGDAIREQFNLVVAGERDRGYASKATRGTHNYLCGDVDKSQKDLMDLHYSLIMSSAQLPLFVQEMAGKIITGRQTEVEEAKGKGTGIEESTELQAVDLDAKPKRGRPKGKKSSEEESVSNVTPLNPAEAIDAMAAGGVH